MRVLISGYYGFGNLGDEAILAGLASVLRGAGHEPVVLSGDPRATAAMHGVAAVDRYVGLPAALLRADAVLSGGGGIFQDVSSGRSLSYYLGVVQLARALRRRVVGFGQSLGPLSESGKKRVARGLRGVSLGLRDEGSMELAAELGLDATLVADAALWLGDGAGKGRGTGGGPVLLVPRGDQVGLNLALATLGAELSRRGVPVAAMAFQPAVDAPAVEALRDAVPGLLSWDAPDPGAAVRAVAEASFVVSVRLHGCILAAAAGVGFAGLSYDPKVRGFARLAGAESFELPVGEEELLRVVLEARPLSPEHAARLRELSSTGEAWLLGALAGEGDR